MAEPAAEQPEAIDQAIPSPPSSSSSPPAASAPPSPASPLAAAPAPSPPPSPGLPASAPPPSPPPPASSTAPQSAPASPPGPSSPVASPSAPSSPVPAARSAPASPVVAASTNPEQPATLVVAQPPSPTLPPPPAPSRAPSASPAGSSPASMAYVEAPVPANASTPLPPPATSSNASATVVVKPAGEAKAAVVVSTNENKTAVVTSPDKKTEVLVERQPSDSTRTDAPKKVEVVVEKPADHPKSEPERIRIVEPVPVQETAPAEKSKVEPIVVVEPTRSEPVVTQPVERASTIAKNVAFEPTPVEVVTTERAPAKVVVEDSSVRVEPATRPFQDIPAEVPPVIIASAEPSRYIDPEIKIERPRFRDRIRQGLHPGYWRSLFRRHNREKPQTHLRPRKRDRLRAKFLTRAALVILIGRRPTTIVKPIVEEAAVAPRGRHHRHWSRWEALKRLFFIRRHSYARRRHSEKAELHEVYRKNARRENFEEAEWRHAERQARHQRKAIYHAEKQIRGRRRYTDDDIRAAAADYPPPAPRQEDRLTYAARHLREARRNLEANIERGQRQVMRRERRVRHPVRRLEKDVQNLELQKEQVRKEIDELTREANEHSGELRETVDQWKLRAALDREEKVKRNLEVARERLRNAQDHVERDDVHRRMENRPGNREDDQVVVYETPTGKPPEHSDDPTPLAGTALDGNSQSATKRTVSPTSGRDRSYYPSAEGVYPIYAQSSGFKRQQELSGESPRAHARSRSSSQSSFAESFKSGSSARELPSSLRNSTSASTDTERDRRVVGEVQRHSQLAPSAADDLRVAANQKRLKTWASLSSAPKNELERPRGWRSIFKRRRRYQNVGRIPDIRSFDNQCPLCGRPFDRVVARRTSGSLRSDRSGSITSSRLARANSKDSISSDNNLPTELWGAKSFRIDI